MCQVRQLKRILKDCKTQYPGLQIRNLGGERALGGPTAGKTGEARPQMTQRVQYEFFKTISRDHLKTLHRKAAKDEVCQVSCRTA